MREKDIVWRNGEDEERASRHLTRELACSPIPLNLEVLNLPQSGNRIRIGRLERSRYPSGGSKTSIRFSRERNTRENTGYHLDERFGNVPPFLLTS